MTKKSFLSKILVLGTVISLLLPALLFLAKPKTVAAATLSVTLSAHPSSGPAPLNDVDLTAQVSGTATGSITYKFDCTSNGSWERIVTTSSTSYTATDLCDYSSPGSYTAKVRVERGNLSFEGITGIFVQEGPTLSVTLSANPSSGIAPLNDVDLTAQVSGTATGSITYKFDCTSNGSWERIVTTSSTSYTATDLCDYPNAGVFMAKVKVERQNLSFVGTTGIFVQSPTVSVTLSAHPSSGPAPLNDVDLTAQVSGTATGSITYKFDCTNDGSWEKTTTTTSNPYTAFDLCDYPSQGTYTAKVRVERQGVSDENTTTISVAAPLTLHLAVTTSPSSGHAPLNDVDITAQVSGTATGSITYKFDCTGDGSWEKTLTTSSTSYTAYDLCDYSSAGVYSIKVSVERQGLLVEGIVNVIVDTIATLAIDFSANPSSGSAPLNDVDLTAFVSGTAMGTITYQFDCTNNGSWEKTVTTSSTSYTAYDLCDYSSAGEYTAKVKVSREAVEVEGTTTVLVF
jgi:hypothetical protein